MISELVVDVQPKEVSIAVLEDKNLVELQKEARNVSFAVGDIYLGKVKKLMPGLNAAFIDVGYKKDAFLHYLDLGPNFNTQQKFLKQALGEQKGDKKIPTISKMQLLPEIEKDGSISNVLKVGQEVLVQIAKEPISTKGPRLTSELSFAGRYIVLIPFADKVSVSTKIKSSEERARLRQLIQSIKPKNFSVIVRTSSEGKRVAELDHELKTLLKRWEENIPKITKVKAPALIYEETARAVALLRDIFNPSFQNIYVNDADIYHNIRDYVSLIAPGREEIVQRYTGELPIFDNFAITKQIKSLFGRTVTYKSGAYLIIEHTEAMHVIDVNSGNRSKGSDAQEKTAIDVNTAAADEIARQLRLRDMGGIIVVDFIDMAEAANRQKLFEHMTKAMANDRAKHNILPLSKFGLEEIVQRYTGELPIFDNFAITKQIKSLFGRTVTYKSGAYLIIEHTEAMHVIDVNSGNRSKGSDAQEKTAIDVNTAAADEIARQLRLRDMGGIIVVDFIDMAEAANRQKLFEHMTKAMANDRAKHNILPLSKFGLMQITRQRVRPAMDVDTSEACPTCFGTGTIKPSILFTDSLEGKIDCLVNKHNVKKFALHVHPYVAAFIKSGKFPLSWKWKLKYSMGIKVIPNQSLGFLEYKFIDSDKNELDMMEEKEIK